MVGGRSSNRLEVWSALRHRVSLRSPESTDTVTRRTGRVVSFTVTKSSGRCVGRRSSSGVSGRKVNNSRPTRALPALVHHIPEVVLPDKQKLDRYHTPSSLHLPMRRHTLPRPVTPLTEVLTRSKGHHLLHLGHAVFRVGRYPTWKRQPRRRESFQDSENCFPLRPWLDVSLSLFRCLLGHGSSVPGSIQRG